MPDSVQEEMNRLGLHPMAAEDLMPELVRDGDEGWLTIAHKGVRVRLCKVSFGRLLLLNEQAARIAVALGPR